MTASATKPASQNPTFFIYASGEELPWGELRIYSSVGYAGFELCILSGNMEWHRGQLFFQRKPPATDSCVETDENISNIPLFFIDTSGKEYQLGEHRIALNCDSAILMWDQTSRGEPINLPIHLNKETGEVTPDYPAPSYLPQRTVSGQCSIAGIMLLIAGGWVAAQGTIPSITLPWIALSCTMIQTLIPIIGIIMMGVGVCYMIENCCPSLFSKVRKEVMEHTQSFIFPSY